MYRREATIRYFRAQGCSLHEAEDLTQEVQIRLYLARSRGVSITPGYWHHTCRSVLNDYLRHLRQERECLVSLEECTDFPSPANAEDDGSFLEECWQVLCEQQREVLRLHVVEEWSFAEIAEVLGKSPEAVHKQYQRAIARLRKYFCSQDRRAGGVEVIRFVFGCGSFSGQAGENPSCFTPRKRLLYTESCEERPKHKAVLWLQSSSRSSIT